MAFTRILVANRGEIACRVIRTARAMGYATVAVYSEADRGSPHVTLADTAVRIGPAPVGESYLNVARILEAARASGADAIHPGYGFLSENAGFAQACADAGITFVGPPPDAIELMGNKRASKIAMREAGVPCVPGYDDEDQRDERLIEEAKKIGLPVMVKAAAGGGGRGMRLVAEERDLAEAMRSARSEAESAFGSGELILEKAVVRPRHVEIQVFADTHGAVVHLGERDCSVQRRHQKVVEECPSPAVHDLLRDQMGEAAVRAAQACGYVGAGTVEFLLDESGEFYFLEMNTRLQVEHPVTELVTGIDLVEWQIRVASGEELPLDQEDIGLLGHAIEVRLYAEDPAAGFLPQTGTVLHWEPAEVDETRIDHAVADGVVVSPHYDPMIAKIIAYGRHRDEARRKLSAALEQTVLLGVTNNKGFLAAVCEHPVFAAGEATTAFLADEFADDATLAAGAPSAERVAVAALLFYLRSGIAVADDADLLGWRSGGPVWSLLEIATGDAVAGARIDALGAGAEGPTFAVGVALDEDGDPEPVEVEVLDVDEPVLVYVDGTGVRRTVRFAFDAGGVWVQEGAGSRFYEDVTHAGGEGAGGAGTGQLIAPIDGAVVAVLAEPGAAVTEGQVLVVVEAMKMEHPIKSDVDGTLENVLVSVGEQVGARQLVAQVEPTAGNEES